MARILLLRTPRLGPPTGYASALSTAVAPIFEGNDLNSQQQEPVPGNQIIIAPPTLDHTLNFVQELTQKSMEWFWIRVDAISIYTYYLCAVNCSPGRRTSAQITAAINQAIAQIRQLQLNSVTWNPENVPIIVNNQPCTTRLEDPKFGPAFRAEVVLSRDILFQTAYDATRKLLVPTHQQHQQFRYPRIVFLQCLSDVDTASLWRAQDGSLLWEDWQGFSIFHFNEHQSDGTSNFIWFGRPELPEFLYHFFANSTSVGFIEVYNLVQNSLGQQEWVEMVQATDPMLAFGLGWIVAVMESDVLQHKRFRSYTVTKRRKEHFVNIYNRILTRDWTTRVCIR